MPAPGAAFSDVDTDDTGSSARLRWRHPLLLKLIETEDPDLLLLHEGRLLVALSPARRVPQ